MRVANREEAAGLVQAHVPLKPTWFQILLSIAAGERHGYAIRQSVELRTEGKVRLWPATLYGTLRQIAEAGLISEQAADTHDARGTRSFELTPGGRAVLDAETRRLAGLVELVRATGALAD